MSDFYKDHSEIRQLGIQVLTTPERIKQQYLNLIKAAVSEILLVFPTVNAIQREYTIGVMDELNNAVERGVKIRILSAEDDFIKQKLDALRASGIVIRAIETPTEAKFKMLIVDRKASLIIETRDDSRASFKDAVGLAVFSNSKATVLPSVTIFESFWRETDLYEKARESDRIKDEFVNIAAHELRNPIMPILSGADLLKAKLESYKDNISETIYDEFYSDIQLLVRNASKLLKLSEDILQVSRIESGTFTLHLDAVDLDALIINSIADAKKRYAGEKHEVKIVYESKLDKGKIGRDSPFKAFYDAGKLSQTLFNLLDNAVKFTEKGRIVVSAWLDEAEVRIAVRDSGQGIDPEIRDRLFEKFASKSNGGTGLGLYLSRKIIEAHGGSIWGTNNRDSEGATFTIALPLDLPEPASPGESKSSQINGKDDAKSFVGNNMGRV